MSGASTTDSASIDPTCPMDGCRGELEAKGGGWFSCTVCTATFSSVAHVEQQREEVRRRGAILAAASADKPADTAAPARPAEPPCAGPDDAPPSHAQQEPPAIDRALREDGRGNTQTEKMVLGAMLLDESCIGVVRATLKAEDFSSGKHLRIFLSICSLNDRGITPDIRTLTDELQENGYLPAAGGESYVSSLTNETPTSANVQYYADRIAEVAKKRRLSRIAKTLADEADSGTAAAEVARKARQALEGFAGANTETSPEKPVSFRQRQTDAISPRIWYVDGMICPGFNMITAKKAMGKSFLMMQTADAIAKGEDLLGRRTTKTKVLLVSFELDEGDTSERFRRMAPLSENAYIMHDWPKGEAAFEHAERVIKLLGIKVIMFDTMLPLLPLGDPNFKLNEYGDSGIYLKWRLLGKRNDAAIVASWHEGKTPRDDFLLNAIGSTGMVAQADNVISIDRKRGEAAGKLYTAGNHAKDSALSVIFEGGLFKLGEGEISTDRLTPDEEKTMAVLAKHPAGASPSEIGLATHRNDNAARAALNRLIARKRVVKVKRGLYGIAPDPAEQPELEEVSD